MKIHPPTHKITQIGCTINAFFKGHVVKKIFLHSHVILEIWGGKLYQMQNPSCFGRCSEYFQISTWHMARVTRARNRKGRQRKEGKN